MFRPRQSASGRPTQTGYCVNRHEYFDLRRAMSAVQSGTIARLPDTTSKSKCLDFPKTMTRDNFEWETYRREGSDSDRAEDRPTLSSDLILTRDSVHVPKMTWDEGRGMALLCEEPRPGEYVLWPDRRRWRREDWRWEWQTRYRSRPGSSESSGSNKAYVHLL